MNEMMDAVAFMWIFLDFKRVEPATTAAGVQSQPFSFTATHVMSAHVMGALSFQVLHIIRSTFEQQRWVLFRTQIVALPA